MIVDFDPQTIVEGLPVGGTDLASEPLSPVVNGQNINGNGHFKNGNGHGGGAKGLLHGTIEEINPDHILHGGDVNGGITRGAVPRIIEGLLDDTQPSNYRNFPPLGNLRAADGQQGDQVSAEERTAKENEAGERRRIECRALEKIDGGEVVIVVGSTGSGKTTLQEKLRRMAIVVERLKANHGGEFDIEDHYGQIAHFAEHLTLVGDEYQGEGPVVLKQEAYFEGFGERLQERAGNMFGTVVDGMVKMVMKEEMGGEENAKGKEIADKTPTAWDIGYKLKAMLQVAKKIVSGVQVKPNILQKTSNHIYYRDQLDGSDTGEGLQGVSEDRKGVIAEVFYPEGLPEILEEIGLQDALVIETVRIAGEPIEEKRIEMVIRMLRNAKNDNAFICNLPGAILAFAKAMGNFANLKASANRLDLEQYVDPITKDGLDDRFIDHPAFRSSSNAKDEEGSGVHHKCVQIDGRKNWQFTIMGNTYNFDIEGYEVENLMKYFNDPGELLRMDINDFFGLLKDTKFQLPEDLGALQLAIWVNRMVDDIVNGFGDLVIIPGEKVGRKRNHAGAIKTVEEQKYLRHMSREDIWNMVIDNFVPIVHNEAVKNLLEPIAVAFDP